MRYTPVLHRSLIPTLHNSVSTLDHLLAPAHLLPSFSNCLIIEDDSLNLSDLSPVCASLWVLLSPTPPQPSQSGSSKFWLNRSKPMWIWVTLGQLNINLPVFLYLLFPLFFLPLTLSISSLVRWPTFCSQQFRNMYQQNGFYLLLIPGGKLSWSIATPSLRGFTRSVLGLIGPEIPTPQEKVLQGS